MYDGTIIRVNTNLKLTVVVQDPSTLANKTSIGVQNRYYNPEL
jgi:hypothetical protein